MESPETITIQKPGPPAIVAELSPLVLTARAFEVADRQTHEEALTRIKRLRDGEKSIDLHFDQAQKAAHQAHRAIVAAVAALKGPIAQARAIYDQAAARYEREERERAAAESKRLEDQARKEEEDRQLMEALNAEESGQAQVAEAIVSQPIAAPVITVAPQVAKVAGVVTRSTWSPKINDPEKCLRFMLDRPEWAAVIAEKFTPVLETILRPFAVAQRQALNIPGVQAVETQSRR